MQEAGKLAESTAILLNVSEFDDATKASEALISTMQAFQYTADESQHVVDILNEVGNNYAVSSDGIATALQDSASALMSAGNNLEQSVALVAAANKVVQDPNSVGSALRTISLRLRGTSVKVLEEMGEETEGVIESTSKLQAKIKALSGVDILTNAGDYKDTYTILKEIGTVWEDMSDIDQAALLELMAGKNRANTLSAILSNMTDLEGAYKSALNAEGSALKENEAYLDSIQGRIDLFNNSVQTMWMNFINSDAVKFVVNLGTGFIKLADNIGVIKTALIGIVGYLTLIKKTKWSEMIPNANLRNPITAFQNTFAGGFKSGMQNIFSDITKVRDIQLLSGQLLNEEIDYLNFALKEGGETYADYKKQVQGASSGMDIFVNKIERGVVQTKNGKVSAQDYTLALQNQTTAAQKAARAEQLKNIAIGAAIMAITYVVSAITNYVQSLKTLEQTYDELQSSISDVESKINSIDSELAKIDEQIDDLSNKNLSLVEAEELRKLKEQSAELQKQKEIQEDILKTREKQNSVQSLSMINKLLNTTAANQEKTASSAKMWGQIIGGTVLAAVGAVAAYFTAGASLALTAAGVGMVAGSAAGGALFENISMKNNAVSGNDMAEKLINWYDSYEKAIIEAEQQAAEAEEKYLSNVTDKNYEKWQKKLEAVNTLQTDLYNGLQDMQEYVDNLEYNEQTSGIIDGYNKLITNVSVKSFDGNIDAQISSIESLKDEFYKLSRGVADYKYTAHPQRQELHFLLHRIPELNRGYIKEFDLQYLYI